MSENLSPAVLDEVHPRIRGEDTDWSAIDHLLRGSPPHTRGRSADIEDGYSVQRFTPAYAGKIRQNQPGICRRQVHPRIRGEDYAADRKGSPETGSPPHTRGRFLTVMHRAERLGFTPAYAGKIACNRKCTARPRVHPRIRGEDLSDTVPHMPAGGSPPHTRGRFSGIRLAAVPIKVHPRIRGEDVEVPAGIFAGDGSPPHTRGRFLCGLASGPFAGFTPAYAGKIAAAFDLYLQDEVHPRIRGEDMRPAEFQLPEPGSPPHTRGRFDGQIYVNRHERFTPAYAGKICPLRMPCIPQTVHPRIRGEDL